MHFSWNEVWKDLKIRPVYVQVKIAENSVGMRIRKRVLALAFASYSAIMNTTNILEAYSDKSLFCSLYRSLWASCGSSPCALFILGSRPREEEGDKSPNSYPYVAYGITTHILRLQQSYGRAWCLGWNRRGDHPSPRMLCRSHSSKWAWIIFQGGQPIIGNDSTLSSLLSESFSYFGRMVRCIPSAHLFWFSNHKPEPSPRDIWGLSTKNRYYMWSVRVSCSANLVCRLQPLKFPSWQCYLW